MEFEENFTCPLCLELAKQAVESTCCTKIYCLQCVENAVQKYNHCPCCRSQDIKYHPSRIARKVISEIKVPCQNCQLKVEIGQMSNHLTKCPKIKIKCKICHTQLSQAEMPVHTAKNHEKQAKQYLIQYVLDQKKNKSSKLIEPPKPVPQDHNYFQPVLNKFNRRASLGNNGKYYCGGELRGKCSCCNGHCGPDDGQNCDGCMELDVKRWSLARTYMVNSSGYICQVIRVQGTPRVSCFRIYGNKKGGVFSKGEPITCKIGSACSPCVQLQNSISHLNRYAGLF